MASSGKKKTTMAKLTRERRLRERRLDKQAKKDARKYAAAHPEEFSDVPSGDVLTGDVGEPAGPNAGEPAVEAAVQALPERPDPSLASLERVRRAAQGGSSRMRRGIVLMVGISVALALPAFALAASRVIHGPAGPGVHATIDIQFNTTNQHPTKITRLDFANIPAACSGSFPTAVSDTWPQKIPVSSKGNFHSVVKRNAGRVTYTVSGHFTSQNKATGTLRVKGTVPGCRSADTGTVHWSAKH
jgi:hypothetical protein